ncbi:MAG: ABC transporter ATP-binding protein [Candidatus Hodarchaeota archaeon]
MENIIETQELVKIFKNNTIALNGISIGIKKGEIMGFLGPNGAGKTTTVRLLSCLLKPTSGDAFVFGKSIKEDPLSIRERIGVLTENHGLYERMTVEENMKFFSSFYSESWEQNKSNFEKLLEEFNLEDRRNAKVGTLSKGLRQRAALIKTLIHDPELIFLDEPTSGLDPKATAEFRDYIKYLGKKRDKTIIICTHNLTEAQKLCSRIAIINKGKIMKVGPPSELERVLWKSSIFRFISTKPFPADLQGRIEAGNDAQVLSIDGPEMMLSFQSKPDTEVIPNIIEDLVSLKIPVFQVIRASHSLEDIYLKLMEEA